MRVPGGSPGRLRVGVVLPTFTADGSAPLAAARQCEDAGLDGVFAYDHLWPMGHAGRPALSPYPVLGAVAAATSTVAIGTLVARVGLVRTDVLVSELFTLDALAPGRLIAAVGTGDRKSEEENRAFGIAYVPAPERRALLGEAVTRLLGASIETWVGGGSDETNAVARGLGAVLNLWNPSAERLREAAASGPTTFGGSLPRDPAAGAKRLETLASLGIGWAVFNWPGSAEPLVAAASLAGVSLR